MRLGSKLKQRRHAENNIFVCVWACVCSCFLKVEMVISLGWGWQLYLKYIYMPFMYNMQKNSTWVHFGLLDFRDKFWKVYQMTIQNKDETCEEWSKQRCQYLRHWLPRKQYKILKEMFNILIIGFLWPWVHVYSKVDTIKFSTGKQDQKEKIPHLALMYMSNEMQIC